MIQTTDAILEAVGKKQQTVAVLLYMSKVFDSMDHEILMTKVYDLGLSPLAIKWFRSYLQSRYQVVKIHNVTSDQLLMTCGVPQEAFWVRCFLVSTPELPSIPQRSAPPPPPPPPTPPPPPPPPPPHCCVDDTELMLNFNSQEQAMPLLN